VLEGWRNRSNLMKKILPVMVVVATLPAFGPAAQAPNPSLDDLFTRVSPTVVVVRSKGRDVSAGGVTRFNGAGSGVLVSSDGRVMTAPTSSTASRPVRAPMSRSCSSSE
jgi:S1-C subfamily serine protease